MSIDGFEPIEFARSFQEFLTSFARLIPPHANEIGARAARHLGVELSGLPSYSEKLDPAEHQNLQLAINAKSSERPWELIGLPSDVRNYGGFSLLAFLAGRFGFGQVSPEYVNLPVAVDETLPCILSGLYLAWQGDHQVLALVTAGVEHGPRHGLSVEVVAGDAATVQAFLADLKVRMAQLNVYRGKLLAYTTSEYGQVVLTFVRLPVVTRDDIVLPDGDLDAIQLHTVGVSERAHALRAAGQHLKRGLLLYGPPGTGKTYSIMHLCNLMPGRTTVLLNGPAAMALGRAIAIARSLQPSMVVLEDVDLIAMERTRPGMDTNPLLFQLLNEMDGLASDADIIFVLTTNRVDLLEPALASRPGRIDQAIEIDLPDVDGRRKLLELYLRNVPNTVSSLDLIAQRADGSSPAFIKELVRRAVLAAADPEGGPGMVTAGHLTAALEGLLQQQTPIARAMLGTRPANDPAQVAITGPGTS